MPPEPHFPNLPIRTARLTLRPLDAADADALFAIFSDPQVMRYWSSPPWTTRDQAHAFIERDRSGFESGAHLRLGIARTDDGALLGQCTLFSIHAGCRRAEVGYGLGRPHWGQGYVHEALLALLNYGFEQLNLNRVEADVDPRNTASAKVLERLGFRKEGHLHERWIVAGEVSDSALYGLLRKGWPGRAS